MVSRTTTAARARAPAGPRARELAQPGEEQPGGRRPPCVATSSRRRAGGRRPTGARGSTRGTLPPCSDLLRREGQEPPEPRPAPPRCRATCRGRTGRRASGQQKRNRAHQAVVVAGEQHGGEPVGLDPADDAHREVGHSQRGAVLDPVDDAGAAAEGLEVGGPVRAAPAVLVHLADPAGQLVAEQEQAAVVRRDDPGQLLGGRVVGDQPLPGRGRRRVDLPRRLRRRLPFLTAALTSLSQISRRALIRSRAARSSRRRSSKSLSSSRSRRATRSRTAS